jgi:putative ABC transport system ATP-binding protein
MTILMVTHEADVAARAQRVLHFQDGRVLDPEPVG